MEDSFPKVGSNHIFRGQTRVVERCLVCVDGGARGILDDNRVRDCIGDTTELAFIFSEHPFYSFYEHAPRLWGFSAIRDQNLGGIAMNGEQTLVFLLTIGYFVLRLLDEENDRSGVSEADGSPARG